MLIIVILLIWALASPSCTADECQNDKDCTGDKGICNAGKCQACAFDSDCCGSETCQSGKCISGGGGTTPPPTDCGSVAPFCLNNNEGQVDQENGPRVLDLTGSVPMGVTFDWSTFQFTSIRVFSHFNQNDDDIRDWCDNDIAGTPYGTHVEAFFNVTVDACGPAVEGPANFFTWEGCSTTGVPNGRQYTVEWTHDGNGVITGDFFETGDLFNMYTYWEINYSVQDTDGCTYNETAYYTERHSL